jgi:hypothetical protein
VVNLDSLLLPDEQHTGTYSVEIARWNGGRWTATVPPLYASLTDRRLILHPQTRRRYDPAIIPRRSIRRITELDDPYRRGVVLHLEGGTLLNIFTAGYQGETFITQLHAMHEQPVVLPACPVRFDTRVEVDRLLRLIHRVEAM